MSALDETALTNDYQHLAVNTSAHTAIRAHALCVYPPPAGHTHSRCCGCGGSDLEWAYRLERNLPGAQPLRMALSARAAKWRTFSSLPVRSFRDRALARGRVSGPAVTRQPMWSSKRVCAPSAMTCISSHISLTGPGSSRHSCRWKSAVSSHRAMVQWPTVVMG